MIRDDPNAPRAGSKQTRDAADEDEDGRQERLAILRCQGGDAAAFEWVVRRHMRRASAFALAWTGNPEDALDLSQEAFARALRAIRRFDPSRPFYPWLHTILRHLCLNHLGRASRRREVPLADGWDGPGHGPTPAEDLERAELGRQVWSALGDLSASDREILILREFQGLSYAEIASSLGIPKGTVMSRLHQARLRLRQRLEPCALRAAPAARPTAAEEV